MHQGLLIKKKRFLSFCFINRYNQRKNDTVYMQFGPLCNYQSSQTDNTLGQIRIGKK